MGTVTGRRERIVMRSFEGLDGVLGDFVVVLYCGLRRRDSRDGIDI